MVTERKRVASWRQQIAEGRVFELRSSSKKYPPPCALVVNTSKGTGGYGPPMFVGVDQYGVVGDHEYSRCHNPNITISGLRPEQFTSDRVLRRRRDLEKFDRDDLALIRYGCALDFSGRIHGCYSNEHLPVVVPSTWTVFWLPAWDDDDFRIYYYDGEQLARLLRGAWHFDSWGGCRSLGYKFGHAWATRHDGRRLNEVRQFLRSRFGGLIEQQARVVRWNDGHRVYMEEVRRECPALGGMVRYIWDGHDVYGGTFRH